MNADSPHEVLIINCGSSSLKYAWLDVGTGIAIAKGLAERIGEVGTNIRLELIGNVVEKAIPGADHGDALRELVELCWPGEVIPSNLRAVGHRVVHGGEYFREPCLVDADVIAKIDACAELAPLHNPANALGIRIALERFPTLPHIAVFDTAFHQTMPKRAYIYAVPYTWYTQYKVRRYGFHGTSHQFVSAEAARRLGRQVDDCQLVTAHLGNGCSVCAVRDGRSVETSMGLTPSEGLVMGTRSGDIDPNLAEFIAQKTGLSSHQINDMINRKSGLLGISELSNDMRSLVAAADIGNEQAALAIDVFCYRLARQILGMCAGLGRIDALVFTGGIGEHCVEVRAKTLEYLAFLRPEVDHARNAAHGRESNGQITRDHASGLTALVVPTNEEWMIGRFALQLCEELGRDGTALK
jgi:acetate kinase